MVSVIFGCHHLLAHYHHSMLALYMLTQGLVLWWETAYVYPGPCNASSTVKPLLHGIDLVLWSRFSICVVSGCKHCPDLVHVLVHNGWVSWEYSSFDVIDEDPLSSFPRTSSSPAVMEVYDFYPRKNTAMLVHEWCLWVVSLKLQAGWFLKHRAAPKELVFVRRTLLCPVHFTIWQDLRFPNELTLAVRDIYK